MSNQVSSHMLKNFAFSQVPEADIPRSQFDRSHGIKTTFDAGQLVPFYVDEAVPGDTFRLRATIFARLNTPIAPIMDNLYLDTFYFAVPYRLLWRNWEKMMGARDNPDDSIDYLTPVVKASDGWEGFGEGSLGDYFGLPIDVPDIEVSAFPFRAYNLIYNEWFRDQNTQTRITFNDLDGPEQSASYPVRYRNKRHDYFTSCLPWPQKGDPVQITLGTEAPVVGNGGAIGLTNGYNNLSIIGRDINGYSDVYLSGNAYGGSIGNPDVQAFGNSNTERGIGVTMDAKNSGMIADLSESQAITINQLREAFQVQRLLERDARSGTRYTEIIQAHFGVTSPDARMQRPEYLGGSSKRIQINAVQQTSESSENSPQGNLAAFALTIDDDGYFNKSFTEHCVIMGLVNVRADLTYQQGIHRMWSRRGRYDYYWPALANLGEQPVYNRELYCDGTMEDEEVFGYQERWAEYRYGYSRVTGKFRSSLPDSLDVWHLAQDFASRPTLCAEFMQDKPPIDRVVAVTSQPDIIMDSYLDLKCARPMPIYSIPGSIGRF
uniref:Majoy capsid protein n=1 Tax=Chlamydiamicrovirus sp. TaxID=2832664 RepID=A0AB39A3A2_9VIRU